MQDLLDGYRRFRTQRWPYAKPLYESLAHGQNPHTLVIACSDSRVEPAAIFDTDPGDLFTIRNVANLVPPFEQGDGLHGTSAAIEFAVEKLAVRKILVLGHNLCGGVAAALDTRLSADTIFLGGWIDLLAPAKDRLPHSCADRPTALEQESVRVSLERLLSFPFIAAKVARGELTLAGAVFSVADGGLVVLDQASGAFNPVV
jgi:carbonic anhydrase